MNCNKKIKLRYDVEVYLCDRREDHRGNCDSWQKRKIET